MNNMFQKTNTAELEKTISITICVIILGMPLAYLFQAYDVFSLDTIAMGELVLQIGAFFLLVLDVMYFVQKENRYVTVLGGFIILFWISVVISTVFAQDVDLAFSGNSYSKEGCIAVVAYLLLMFNCSLIGNKKNRRNIYVCLILFGTIQLVLGYMQAVIQAPFLIEEISEQFIEQNRALGTIMNPNPYGSVMMLLATMEFGFVYISKNKVHKIVHALLAVGFTYAVLLSGTRGSWVGLAIAAFVGSIVAICLERKKSETKKALKKLALVLMVVIVAVLLFVISSRNTMENVVERSETDISSSSLGYERLLIWKNSFEAYVLNYPFFGVGVSNLNTLTSAHGEGYFISVMHVKDAHNRYLNVWSTQGTFGLLTYLMLIGYVIVKLFKKIIIEKEEMKEEFVLFIAIVGWLVADCFSVNNIYMTPIFYIVLGLAVNRKESKCLLGLKNKNLNNN